MPVDIESITEVTIYGDERYIVQRMGTLGFIRKDDDDRWFFEPFDKMRIFRENLHDIECFIEGLEDA